MYVEKILKNRKMGKCLYKTGGIAGVHKMKEKYTTIESEAAVSSAQSKERSTAVNRLIILTASMCFIYNVDFRNLVKYNDLGV